MCLRVLSILVGTLRFKVWFGTPGSQDLAFSISLFFSVDFTVTQLKLDGLSCVCQHLRKTGLITRSGFREKTLNFKQRQWLVAFHIYVQKSILSLKYLEDTADHSVSYVALESC